MNLPVERVVTGTVRDIPMRISATLREALVNKAFLPSHSYRNKIFPDEYALHKGALCSTPRNSDVILDLQVDMT